MSRFYDALREAHRASPAGTNPPIPADSASSAIGGFELPALDLPEPDQSAGPTMEAHNGPPELSIEQELSSFGFPENPHPAPLPRTQLDLGMEQELLNAVASRQNGLVATQTAIHLDPKARLIPQASNPIIVEHYRRLRTKLLQQQTTKPFRTLLITSPGPAEGKSVTAINLGLSFAMLPSFPVLVVDGDLRKGSLGKWLGIHESLGISNLVDGSAKLDDVILKCDDFPVHFIVRGTSKASPADLLNSPALKTHFRRLSEQYSLVLVDSPPVNLMTDTQLLAASCDAVLLIARAFTTTQKALKKAVQDLKPFRVVGTVLNGGSRISRSSRYRRYYESA